MNPLLISLVEHIIKILVRLVIEKPPGPKQARTLPKTGNLFFFFLHNSMTHIDLDTTTTNTGILYGYTYIFIYYVHIHIL